MQLTSRLNEQIDYFVTRPIVVIFTDFGSVMQASRHRAHPVQVF